MKRIICIYGPQGSGKTTILNAITAGAPVVMVPPRFKSEKNATAWVQSALASGCQLTIEATDRNTIDKRLMRISHCLAGFRIVLIQVGEQLA